MLDNVTIVRRQEYSTYYSYNEIFDLLFPNNTDFKVLSGQGQSGTRIYPVAWRMDCTWETPKYRPYVVESSGSIGSIHPIMLMTRNGGYYLGSYNTACIDFDNYFHDITKTGVGHSTFIRNNTTFYDRSAIATGGVIDLFQTDGYYTGNTSSLNTKDVIVSAKSNSNIDDIPIWKLDDGSDLPSVVTVSGRSITIPSTLASDIHVVANFKIPISVDVDSASSSKSAGTASVVRDSDGSSSLYYNDIARFTATPYGSYTFVEWRLPDGTPVPDSIVGGVTYTSKDSVYKTKIVDETELVAFFGFSIHVSISSFDASPAGSYSVVCSYDGRIVTFDNTDGKIPFANVVGSSVRLTARPNATTSVFVGWFDPSDTAFEHPLSVDAEYTLPSELTTNADFVARFAPKPITATVGVESYSSAVNAGQVTASVAGRAEVADALYGDIMTIIASTNSDYLVGRWEDADGNPLPDSVINNVIYHATDATYKMRLTEDIAIFHRFRGTVTLTPTHSASAHDGTLSVDGKTNVEPVYFGHDFTIRAVPASGEVFKEWYSTDDIGMYNPLRYGSEFTTTFSDNSEWIGHFVADVAADYSYIAICNVDASGLPLPSAGSVVPSALAESTSAEFLAHSGFSSLPSGAVAYYKCLAITDTRIVATAASGMGVLKWSRELVGKTEADVGGVAYYKDDYVFKSAVYRVYWEDKSPQNVRVGYGNSFDYTSGAFALDGLDVANPSINDRHVQFGVITDIYSKDDIVRLGFTANSGCKFAGWYLDAALTVPIPDIEYRDSAYTSASNPSVLKIPSGVNNHVDVYAKIEQDRNAVYEWEGSDVNKSMRWKSKVMAASKPLAPSVVRVDATSYPLSLDVGLFSSPNSERVRGCTIAISGQNARRVPAHNRPERYVQVTVEADHEVDSVIVGTSMAGVSV